VFSCLHDYSVTTVVKAVSLPANTAMPRLALAAPSAEQLHFAFDAFESPGAGERPAEPRVVAEFIPHRLGGQHRSRPGSRRHPAGRVHRGAAPGPGPAHRGTRCDARPPLGKVVIAVGDIDQL